MNDLSIAIQHAPGRADRRQWAQSMIAQLRREEPGLPVKLVADARLEGCWPTYRRALEAAGGAGHHVVLQDDLALCGDFVGSVRAVVRARPDSLVALYTNADSVYRARARGESWIEKAGVSGQAVVWPNGLIGEFIRWQDAHVRRDFPWDDARVSMWLVGTGRRAFATVPSLTQHLGCGASTLGLNGRGKVAAWYVGSERSALGIDWSRGLSLPLKDTTHVRPEWWAYYVA
ncbi:MAG TPA: hypothetical protein VF591_25420 [Pyrinomonadaceae bacterium]|jgi:hypothetical protein